MRTTPFHSNPSSSAANTDAWPPPIASQIDSAVRPTADGHGIVQDAGPQTYAVCQLQPRIDQTEPTTWMPAKSTTPCGRYCRRKLIARPELPQFRHHRLPVPSPQSPARLHCWDVVTEAPATSRPHVAATQYLILVSPTSIAHQHPLYARSHEVLFVAPSSAAFLSPNDRCCTQRMRRRKPAPVLDGSCAFRLLNLAS